MSDTIEPLDLDALKALSDAATPGPWSADETGTVCADVDLEPDGAGGEILPEGGPMEVAECYRNERTGERAANAAFIAVTRSLLPEVLAELVQARAEIERLTGPGTETRTEWAVRWDGYESGTVSYDGEVRARYCYELYAEGGIYAYPGQAVELLTREVRIWAGNGLYAPAWSVVESSTPGAGIAEARAEAAGSVLDGGER